MICWQTRLFDIRVWYIARERYHCSHIVIALALAVILHREVILHRSRTRAGHYHRLGLPTEQVGHVLAEVLDHQLNLLSHVDRIERQPASQLATSAFLINTLVVHHVTTDLERHFVAGVVLQHIEDKALLNRLLHGVKVEWSRRIVRAHGCRRIARAAEQAQGRVFWRSGEGEVAGIAWARARALPHGQALLLAQLLPLCFALSGQHVTQVIRGASAG